MLWTGKLFVFEFIPFDFVLSWNCKIVIFINNSLDLFKIERVNAKYFHFLLCLFHIAMGTYSIVVGERPWLSSALICCPASARTPQLQETLWHGHKTCLSFSDFCCCSGCSQFCCAGHWSDYFKPQILYLSNCYPC